MIKNSNPNSKPFKGVKYESFFIYKNKNIEPTKTRTIGIIVSNKGFSAVLREYIKKDTTNGINHTKNPNKIPNFHFIDITIQS